MGLQIWKHRKLKVKSLSRVRLFATPWTVAHQAPPSMGFSRQEYWSGLPFPSPGDLPKPGIKPRSPSLQADALSSELPGKNRGVKQLPQITQLLKSRARNSAQAIRLFSKINTMIYSFNNKGKKHNKKNTSVWPTLRGLRWPSAV